MDTECKLRQQNSSYHATTIPPSKPLTAYEIQVQNRRPPKSDTEVMQYFAEDMWEQFLQWCVWFFGMFTNMSSVLSVENDNNGCLNAGHCEETESNRRLKGKDRTL